MSRAGNAPLRVPSASSEPLASVLRILQLDGGKGPDSFVGTSLPQLGGRVYGGQVMAQALLAAAATVPGASVCGGSGQVDDVARLPHSVHAVFLRPGALDLPLEFRVERLHDGRSFSRRRTAVYQDGQAIMTLVSAFQVEQRGLEFSGSMPNGLPGPDELKSALELFRTVEHPVAKFLGKTLAMDVRHVGSPLYVSRPKERVSEQLLWMRARGEVPAGICQTVARALLLYTCDQVMLEPVLRGHGIHWLEPGLSLATLDHSMWFHADVNPAGWHLYQQDAPAASGGRGLARASIFAPDGTLVASASQEGMVRVPGDDPTQAGRDSFLDTPPAGAPTADDSLQETSGPQEQA